MAIKTDWTEPEVRAIWNNDINDNYIVNHISQPNDNTHMVKILKTRKPDLSETSVRDMLNELVKRGAIVKRDHNMIIPDGGVPGAISEEETRAQVESHILKSLGQVAASTSDASHLTYSKKFGGSQFDSGTEVKAEMYVCIHPQYIGNHFDED